MSRAERSSQLLFRDHSETPRWSVADDHGLPFVLGRNENLKKENASRLKTWATSADQSHCEVKCISAQQETLRVA